MLDPGILIALFGLYPDAFALGLIGAGLWATSQGELDTRPKTGAAILFCAITSGLLAAPAARSLHTRYLPELDEAGIRPGLAFLMAVFVPAGIRYAMSKLKPKEGDKPKD